jgi:hypothetical protein
MPFESEPMDLSALSPGQATAKLAEMSAAASPPPPIAPATAADARARLDVLTKDQAWGKSFLDGNADARREFASLIEQVTAADDVQQAIDGTAPPAQPLETNINGSPSRRVVAEVIASMRQNGIADDVIAQTLRGDPVTRAEFEAVKQYQRARHGDPDWVSRLLKGGYAERREHELMNIVLSSEVRDG